VIMRASDSLTRMITVNTTDGTARTITITVNGTNDGAVISGTDAGTVREDMTLASSGKLNVTDVDAGQAAFVAQTVTDGSYGTFAIDSAGNWTYNLNNSSSAVQNLVNGSSLIRTFTVATVDGTTRSVVVTLQGTDDAVSPTLTASNASGNEDTGIPLNVSAALVGGNQTLTSVVISGIPTGATLTNTAGDSIAISGGSATLTASQLNGLQIRPPTNNANDFTLGVRANSTGTDGSTAFSTTNVSVTVVAVADTPNLSVQTGPSQISTPTPPTSTGLTLDRFTAITTVDTTVAANANNLEAAMQSVTPTASSTVTTLSPIGGISLPVDTAVRVNGLLYLEAGKSYVFSGYRDDTFHVEVAGNAVFSQGYNNSGNYATNAFVPTASGYYTFEVHAYNGSGTGSFDLQVAVNGAAAQSIGALPAYRTIADVDASGTLHGGFVGTSDGGYYPASVLDSGYIQVGSMAASLVDTDGSESLSLVVRSIPIGAVLTDGVRTFTATAGSTQVNVTGWNLSSLWLQPPSYSADRIQLQVDAISTEAENGATAIRTAAVPLAIRTISISDASVDEPGMATVQGSIVRNSAGRTSVDQWTIQHGGGALSITAATSSSIDGALYLYRVNANGTFTLITSDDDSGPGNNPLITQSNLAAGRYMVAFGSENLTNGEASDLTTVYANNGGAAGTYSLTFNNNVQVVDTDQLYLRNVSGQSQITEPGYEIMTFTVTLDQAPTASSGPVTVDYRTVNGSALAGAIGTGDFGSVTGSLTFAVGETSKTVSVPVYSDSAAEGTESFTLELLNLSGNARYSASATTSSSGIQADGFIYQAGSLEIGDPSITGTSGRDVISGDLGGVLVDGVEGASVVYVIDTSGSMAYDAATGSATNVTVSRMAVVKSVLAQLTSEFRNAALAGAPVTLTFITYGGTTATTSTTFTLSNATQYQNAVNYLNGLIASGGTPQDQAVNSLRTFLQGLGADVNLGKVYFVTDGTPTNTTAATTANNNLLTYMAGLVDPPEIHGIAIGNGVNQSDVQAYLSPIDNTVNPDGSTGAAIAVDATTLPDVIVGLAPVQANTIDGGDGGDIIFGDVINTDALTGTSGHGYQGLLEYLRGTLGHEPSQQEARDYILTNHDSLNVGGDTRGGNDVINGGGGDDVIYGQGGNDIIQGGTGNDRIVGGEGNDTMDGGTGSDVFVWELNDGATAGSPAVDTITDFSTAAPSAGGDVLDLRDLLVDEGGHDLTKYLHFQYQGADTLIHVSTTGGFTTGYDSAVVEQTIVLKNVDLTVGFTDQASLIQNLLDNGKLLTD
jgi:VCBS repeat-containing protein